MLAQGVLNFVEAALALVEGIESVEVGGELVALGASEALLDPLDVFAEEVEQVALCDEVVLGAIAFRINGGEF